jgi:hypothetical protein
MKQAEKKSFKRWKNFHTKRPYHKGESELGIKAFFKESDPLILYFLVKTT